MEHIKPILERLKLGRLNEGAEVSGQFCPECDAFLAIDAEGWGRCGNCGAILRADDCDSDYEDYHLRSTTKLKEIPPSPSSSIRVLNVDKTSSANKTRGLC